jgi:hypothetical protein
MQRNLPLRRSNMNKKVYFAGSIRGGRVDAELYGEIISYIKQTDRVLTEHVGDLGLSVLEQTRGRDCLIYTQDTAWLRESDVVIAECTCPSLGVGYELAYAESCGKECHILYNKTACEMSAMLNGDRYFHLHPYETKAEIFRILDEILH